MEYELIRSKRKTISISIKPDGSILVRAPKHASIRAIEEHINNSKDWIEKHQQKVLDENARLLDVTPLSKTELDALYLQAKEVFPARCEYYARLLGVDYNRITIRTQKTLWGSCSAKGNLNFNALLVLAPPAVLDYVVVHELSHRIEMNHSKAFWAIVDSVLPDYKTHRAYLKKEGNLLMARIPTESDENAVFYTYMVKCADNTLYTGYTTNLEARIATHNAGDGAKYTKLRLPVELVYFEIHNSKKEAMSREALIKQLSRIEKEALIKNFQKSSSK